MPGDTGALEHTSESRSVFRGNGHSFLKVTFGRLVAIRRKESMAFPLNPFPKVFWFPIIIMALYRCRVFVRVAAQIALGLEMATD